MKRPPARIIGVVLLCLLAGAIVNVAVAWGFAAGVRGWAPSSIVYSHEGPMRWRATITTSLGVTVVGAVPLNGMWSDDHMNPTEPATTGSRKIPYWSRAISPPSHTVWEDASAPWRNEFGFGWPARSTLAIMEKNVAPPKRQWHSVSGLMFDGWPPPLRILPLRPLWPGFAINTVFYAVILWGLFAAPFALRRRMRIKRGLCPKCAYPVGTNAVCTECGAAVVTQKVETQKAESA